METIVTALLGGVAAAAGKVASKAVEDAYASLKRLLVQKLGAESDAVDAVSKLEAKPDSESRKGTLKEELEAAKVGDDPAVVKAAQELQRALGDLPPESRASVQKAVGSFIAQASGGSTATVSGINTPHPKP